MIYKIKIPSSVKYDATFMYKNHIFNVQKKRIDIKIYLLPPSIFKNTATGKKELINYVENKIKKNFSNGFFY